MQSHFTPLKQMDAFLIPPTRYAILFLIIDKSLLPSGICM
nr:MAG TPA: hypothetical protein [Caudoviricetes sp.]